MRYDGKKTVIRKSHIENKIFPKKLQKLAFKICLGTRQLSKDICIFSNVHQRITAEAKLSWQHLC